MATVVISSTPRISLQRPATKFDSHHQQQQRYSCAKTTPRLRKAGLLKSMKIVHHFSPNHRRIFPGVRVEAYSDVDKEAPISPATEIGVGVILLKDNNNNNKQQVLLGRRRSSSVGAFTYALPGGHLEFGESFEECASREVKEETGLDIKDIEMLTITNNQVSETVHAIGIYMRAHLANQHQTPQNLEPDKCDGWDWYDLRNLPQPMFEPVRQVLQAKLHQLSDKS